MNTTNLTITTNYVVVPESVGGPVYFNVSDLPEGAGYKITDTASNVLSSTTSSTNLLLWIYTTNIAQGVYTFRLNATGGAEGTIPLVLQSCYIWNGSTNSAVDGPGFWSDPSQWLGGLPGQNADVVFTDLGGQSDVIFVPEPGVTNYLTNCVIDADVTLGSLRFAQTSGVYRAHNILINPGKTLSIVGPGGFALLRDYVDDLGAGLPGFGTMNVSIAGAGARMIVSNREANFAILVANQAQPTLNMSNLDLLEIEVSRVGLGDYRLYPYYWDYQENGYGSYPRRWPCNVYLAKTNVIKAHYVDPDNYTNEITRQHAFVWQNSERYGTGSGVNNFFYFGYSNYIEADGVLFCGRSHSTGNAGHCGFNPAFTNNPVAIFRGVGGGRMSIFCLGDDGGTNTVSGNIKARVNFGSYNGYVDILADKLILSRDTAFVVSNANPTSESYLYIGKGIVDVNDAILGFQEIESKTNWMKISGSASQNYRGYCRAQLYITNGATFKVNRKMILGYTADTNYFDSPKDGTPEEGYGQVTIANGSTLMANEIVVDPGLGVSRANTITLQNGAKLIVTNGILPGKIRLGTLTMNGAELTLHVNGTNTLVYVTNFSTVGSANYINIASVSGLDSLPAVVPIISYLRTPAPTLQIGSMPAGLSGLLSNNAAEMTIDLHISTEPPKVLFWRGNVNGLWDTTTQNWVTESGDPARFKNGDIAVFDDAASTFNVQIAEDVNPSSAGAGIVMSNSTHNYTFSSAGGSIGATTLRKYGAGNLAIDVNSLLAVEVYEGRVSGGGTVGSTIVGAGAVVNFAGNIVGTLQSTGAVTIAEGGQLLGSLIVAGGTLTNRGYVETVGRQTVTLPDSYVVNLGTMEVQLPWSIPSNSTLLNNGVILLRGTGTAALSINDGGTLIGTGLITVGNNGAQAINEARVNINSGGKVIIGNAPNQIAGMGIATRLDFFYGSQTIFDVDPAGGNDVISNKTTYYGFELPGKVNFGANAQQGGTLYINRVGSAQFTPGQELYLFDRTDNTPDNSIPAPPCVTPAPGPGLAWDISDMITNLTLRVGAPPVLTRTLEGGTNLVFSWPWSYRGWRLEYQTNSLSVGLSTNWVTVPGSFVTNYVIVPVGQGYTNWPPNSTIFYRLAYP